MDWMDDLKNKVDADIEEQLNQDAWIQKKKQLINDLFSSLEQDLSQSYVPAFNEKILQDVPHNERASVYHENNTIDGSHFLLGMPAHLLWYEVRLNYKEAKIIAKITHYDHPFGKSKGKYVNVGYDFVITRQAKNYILTEDNHSISVERADVPKKLLSNLYEA